MLSCNGRATHFVDRRAPALCAAASATFSVPSRSPLVDLAGSEATPPSC